MEKVCVWERERERNNAWEGEIDACFDIPWSAAANQTKGESEKEEKDRGRVERGREKDRNQKSDRERRRSIAGEGDQCHCHISVKTISIDLRGQGVGSKRPSTAEQEYNSVETESNFVITPSCCFWYKCQGKNGTDCIAVM
jgi:hypothetical protein